jgi:acyl-CoA synthetase (AMP-forming)/AMP-acid ligase II
VRRILISDILEQAVESHAERIAVEDGRHRITYRELRERVARLAAVLHARAAAPGDRVGILAPNSSLFLEAYFAAARAGMVLVPLNTRGHTQGLARVLEHAGASSLLVHADLVEPGREIARRCGIPMIGSDDLDEPSRGSASLPRYAGRSDDAAQIYYTSGTTGEPKGVVLTHANVCAHAEMAREALALTDADTFGHIAPMFHLADAWATFSITLVGGCHRMVGSFRPEAVIDELSSGITITNLVPTMLGDLVHHPAAHRPYPDLRRILSGGAPITPTLVNQVIATFGCDYVQTYGLTETSPFLTMSLLPEHLKSRPRAVQCEFQCKSGRPLSGVEVRVLGDDGSSVPPDETTVGEIVARGPTVTPGYWRNEEATAQAFRDGWFHTGDLAVLDEEGFVNIVDRKKDVILSGGETIYSTEVENALAEHGAVQQVAVVGVPHPRWGEAVLAVVVAAEGVELSDQALREHAKSHLGAHQVPKAFELRGDLPRTGSGKVAKRLLREEYETRFSTGGS